MTARWVDCAHQLYDAAMKAQATALARDKEAFFNAGGDIYEACVACHNRYIARATTPADACRMQAAAGPEPPPPNQ